MSDFSEMGADTVCYKTWKLLEKICEQLIVSYFFDTTEQKVTWQCHKMFSEENLFWKYDGQRRYRQYLYR